MSETRGVILPNFLIVGAAKSGTTALYQYLRQHPDVFMSKEKEPSFMASRLRAAHRNGIKDMRRRIVTDFDAYCRLFEEGAGKIAIGEASADYLYYYDEAIANIKRYLGNPKIIIMLRNPVDAAFSGYMHLARDNREMLPFEEALAQEEKRIKEDWAFPWRYKKRGFYYEQVKAYLENFPHIRVYLFDDLKKDPQALCQDAYEFLGVYASFTPETRTQFNVSGIPKVKFLNNFFIERSILQSLTRSVGKFILGDAGWEKLRDTLRAKLLTRVEMKPETRKYLCAVFHEDIVKLQELIQRDLGVWLGNKT